MGPMQRGEKLNRRRLTKLAALGLVAMFTWSLAAAPSSIGQAEDITEPEDVASYFTFGDAVPISSYFDHQVLPAPGFGPGFAHSQTEVSSPSAAAAIAWLLDGGIANALHGTTTGASVPTEVNARQPGGEPKAEFTTAGGPVGEDEFGRVAAGVARVSAVHSNAPVGFANAYFEDVCLFPAAGSPPEPPGTYDPDATFPGGDNQAPTPDPGPQSRQCIVSAASIASTSRSFRDNDTVTSIGVSEIVGITIGDRTSDNRCPNCFYIDGMRAEAFASSNGKPGGSRAGYRLMFGRACRRTFVPSTLDSVEDSITKARGETPAPIPAKEEDQCIGDPRRAGFPITNADAGSDVLDAGSDVLQNLPMGDMQAFFDKPLILGDQTCPGTGTYCRIAIRISTGNTHAEPARAERTTSSSEDICRNYAYPEQATKENPKPKPVPECKTYGVKTGPDVDQGQEAKAVAQGIDIDILTLTANQFIPQNEDLDACFETRLPPEVLENDAYGEIKNRVGCPVAGLRSVRQVNVTFGIAQAAAVARPNIVLPPIGGGGGGGGAIPPIDLGPGGAPGVVPPVPLGPGGGLGGGGGLGAGTYKVKIDWGSLSIKPWPAKDLAKALLTAGIIAGMIVLGRKRLLHQT